MWADDLTAAVYGCFDANHRLLYIGQSADVHRRIICHKSTSSWWDQVDHVAATSMLPLRRARTLEADLIGRLRPPFNKRRNPDWHLAGQPAIFGLDREIA